jgi:hypothetical protein
MHVPSDRLDIDGMGAMRVVRWRMRFAIDTYDATERGDELQSYRRFAPLFLIELRDDLAPNDK